MSNNSTNDEFGEILEVENIEAVPIEEREVDEEIFVQLMEDTLLRDVPVSLQNSLSVQERIHKKAVELWNLKEKGSRISKAGKEFRPLVDDLDQGYFHMAPWVIPIVLDEHIVYALTCPKAEGAEEDDEFDNVFTGELKFSERLENRVSQMKELQSIIKKLYDGNINYVTYATETARLTKDYDILEDSQWDKCPDPLPKVRKIKLKSYENLVRYININDKPKFRVGRAPWVINIQVPEKKQKIETLIEQVKTEKKEMVVSTGEDIEIGGFLILPVNKLAQPEQINKYVEESLKNIVLVTENKELDLRKPTFLLFEQGKSSDNKISIKKYHETIKSIIPTGKQVVQYSLEKLSHPDLKSFQQEVKKWGMLYNYINTEDIKPARIIIEETSKKDIPKSLAGIKYSQMKKICEVSGEDSLLRNSIYRSKLMRNLYNELEYTNDLTREYRGKDCILHREIRAYETKDNGSFLLTYSYLHKRKGNEKKEEERLNSIQKRLESEKKSFNKNVKGENVEFDIKNPRESFKKYMKVSEKEVQARKKVPLLESDIENLIKAEKNIRDRKNTLEKSTWNKARRLFLYKIKEFTESIFNQTILEAKLSYNKYKSNNENKLFSPLLKINPKIQNLINQINKLNDFRLKKEIIFIIIEQDGIIINDLIYSISFAQPIFCGHWYYIMLAEKSLKQKDREQVVQQLTSIFGNDSEKDNHCRVCGAYLDRPQFYEAFSLNQYGQVERQAEGYQASQEHTKYLHTQQQKFEEGIFDSVKLCKDIYFKNEVSKRGIKDTDDMKRAVNACEILDRLLIKMDISLLPKQFLGIILVSVQDSKVITDYLSFKQDKIREYKVKKRLPEKEAKNLENNEKFEEIVAISYAAHFSTRFTTLVSAHLLWHLRTSFPSISPGIRKTGSCGFFGFDSEQGFEYIMCLLEEMKTIRARLSIRGKKIDKPVRRKDIEEHLRYWLRTLENNYRYALKRRMMLEGEMERFIKKKGSKRLERGENEYMWDEYKIDPIPNTFIEDVYKAWKNGDVKVIEMMERINLRTKHLAFTFRKKANEIVKKNTSLATPNIVEASCCEQKNDGNFNFVDFFEAFDSSFPKIVNELEVLQKQIDLFKVHSIGPQYIFDEKQKPIPNLNQFPINENNLPDSFIKGAFLAYCHDGISKGEYHNFQNIEFEEIERCIKCGWFKKKLEEEKFTRDRFKDLLKSVFSLTVKNYEIKKIEERKLDFISLKRDSIKGLNYNIQSLASRLANVIQKSRKKDNEKILIKKYTDFLTNIANFENYIPNPPKEEGEKAYIDAFNKRNYFSQQKMKTYINEFLRKNISRVVNGYKPKIQEISFLKGKEKDRWQERIIDDQLWIEDFLTKTNKEYFKKFVFNYTIKDIEKIKGISDIYEKDFKWISIKSHFTLKEATIVLQNYFITQINLFFDISGANEPIFADFIDKLFEKIQKDRNILNTSSKDMTKWKDSKAEDRVLAWARYYDAVQEEDALLFNAPYRRLVEDIYNDPYAQPKSESLAFDDTEFSEEIEKADEESYLISQAKEELGDEANPQSIESFVNDAVEEKEEDEEIEEEIFENYILKEGEEIMDVGTEYGQQPQGTETEGDGFNDYTMTEAWDPVHEDDVTGEAQ